MGGIECNMAWLTQNNDPSMRTVSHASATDSSNQLFLIYLENLTKYFRGTQSKCVVTFDLGLYRPLQ